MVQWDGAKGLETVNLNNVRYRVVPSNAQHADKVVSSSDDHAAGNGDDDDAAGKSAHAAADSVASDAAALDVLEGDDAVTASALLADAQRPELFIAPNPAIAIKARSVLGALYAYAVRTMTDSVPSLQTLHTDEAFDAEQVE